MAQPINTWSEFRKVLKMLKDPAVKEKFETIIIDTADIAYDYCEKYVCANAGVDTIGDIGYGKGYTMVANEFDLPVICGESNMVEAGGLATYGLDYYQLGYLAGEMAVEILVNGADPAEMPIQFLPADKCELTVNEETAAEIGIDLSVLD